MTAPGSAAATASDTAVRRRLSDAWELIETDCVLRRDFLAIEMPPGWPLMQVFRDLRKCICEPQCNANVFIH